MLKSLNKLKVINKSEEIQIGYSNNHGSVRTYAVNLNITDGYYGADFIVIYSKGYSDKTGEVMSQNNILSVQQIYTNTCNQEAKDIYSIYREEEADIIEEFIKNYLFKNDSLEGCCVYCEQSVEQCECLG